MSCSTKPGPAAICAYIKKTTGYDITSADWHTLTRLAEEEGFTVGKGRISEEEARMAARALESNLYRRDDSPAMAAEMEKAVLEGGLTQNSFAVVKYLTRPRSFTPHVVGRVIAARNPKAAALSKNPQDRLFAAEGDVSKKGVAEILAKDPRPEVRDRLLSNPTLPPEVALDLAKKATPEIAMRLANNPAITEEALMLFAKSPNEAIRKEAAVSPYATSAVLDVMSRDRNGTLRVYTATNPNLPLKVQERMVADEDSRVRAALGANRIAEASVLDALSRDPNRDVRMAVAMNPKTPTEAMRLLADDEDSRGVGYRARVALSAREEDERLGR